MKNVNKLFQVIGQKVQLTESINIFSWITDNARKLGGRNVVTCVLQTMQNLRFKLLFMRKYQNLSSPGFLKTRPDMYLLSTAYDSNILQSSWVLVNFRTSCFWCVLFFLCTLDFLSFIFPLSKLLMTQWRPLSSALSWHNLKTTQKFLAVHVLNWNNWATDHCYQSVIHYFRVPLLQLLHHLQ